MTEIEAIEARHSVRAYKDMQISEDVRNRLDIYVKDINEESGLNISIRYDGLEDILGHKVMPYWKAYLLGIPTIFIYTLVWMAWISEELKIKADGLGIEGPHTSWRHMFWWNMLVCLCFGPMIATYRFFRTLNGIERKLNSKT